jgi:crotonobetainyl-CoA:carnitine CoA-transferase CaiB-like acyl-CoA transferase
MDIFRQHTADEWSRRLSACGVPNSPVRTIDEVARDPQSAARRMFQPVLGDFPATGAPVKLPSMPGRVRRPPPGIGEHTREALRELLGLSDSEVDALAGAGVISEGTPAPAAQIR